MKVVLVNGCWDPFHYGHLLHLQEAKKLGTFLIVSVTKNAHVNKGPKRPVFDELERMAVITALRCVNGAILPESAMDAMKKVKPNVFVKGDEYIGQIEPAVLDYCKEHHIQIAYTRAKRYSSTKLLRHYAEPR